MPARNAPPPLSRQLKLVFWALTLALPLLFFALLEGGLRVAGYGASYPLFVGVDGYPEYLAQSREVGRRYFHRTREAPTALHDLFLAEKPADEVRLFVQGGSSAAGFPFYHGAAFSRMLEARLQRTFPDRPIEVINTGMAAVNSYTLLDLAPEILRQRPDAVLIYAGHNEYYGALGVGSTERVGASRTMVNLYLRLRSLRTVQLLGDGLGRLAALGVRGEPSGGSLMARMVGQQTIPYGSADYHRGLRQYEGNLSDLLARYRRAGVPVFVATLVANERDHRPFTSTFQPGTDEADWRRRYEAAVRQLGGGDARGAVAALEALTREDTLAADGFFALGGPTRPRGTPSQPSGPTAPPATGTPSGSAPPPPSTRWSGG
jgi:lysophospholipase L1-like esterase